MIARAYAHRGSAVAAKKNKGETVGHTFLNHPPGRGPGQNGGPTNRSQAPKIKGGPQTGRGRFNRLERQGRDPAFSKPEASMTSGIRSGGHSLGIDSGWQEVGPWTPSHASG